MRTTTWRSWAAVAVGVALLLGGPAPRAAGGDLEEAETILTRLLEHPECAPLRALRTRRLELDRRRHEALKAIFSLRHYVGRGFAPAAEVEWVQREVDRRVGRVMEIWNDEREIRIAPGPEIPALLDDWTKCLERLEKANVDTTALSRRASLVRAYATGRPLTVRTLWLEDLERGRLVQDGQMRDVTNPAAKGASEAERAAVKAVNDYRAALGFTAQVVDASTEAGGLTKENLARRIDAARLESLVPLRALRLDARLVTSARAHAQDMSRRGFFSHHAPADPARARARTSPHTRIREAGYPGTYVQELLANGASTPEDALRMWRHHPSSHRLLLAPFRDLGIGRAKKVWTANLGAP